MITETKFTEAISKYAKLEKRGSFYDMAINLMNKRLEIEAYLLILATWNFAVFRYAVKDFDITGFKKSISDLMPYFDKLKDEHFRTMNFEDHKESIERIYETLSPIEGIKYTGASKIMHLKNRNVFIMWDNYIKGIKSMKYYNRLEVVKSKGWTVKQYGNDADSYIQFLEDMQSLFKDIHYESDKKPFAKAIDEFNYVNITLPIQDMEKQDQKRKKNRS